ncbi:MAG: molybdopterin dinucleotide binding domain-containing protein [Bacteroidota bacterium]
MSKSITRRDILKFAGGGVLGVFFSPLPWKLLDDSAIWTQNWSLTPPLPRGPMTTLYSHCTLCSAGCAVKAQCVSGIPYYLTGAGGSEDLAVKNTVVCPQGIAAHHMAGHPLRIDHPCRYTGKSETSVITAVSPDDALAEIASRCTNAAGTIAIFDRQPDRAISEVYREFAGRVRNGVYVTSPSGADSTIPALRTMMKGSPLPLGYDFEHAKLIASFGAPILDNWGVPGRMASIAGARKDSGLEIVQIEQRYSRTAMQADQWIAVNPGAEKILALAIAGVLLENHPSIGHAKSMIADFTAYKNSVRGFTPESTAAQTGIDAATVRHLAGTMLQSRSTIVLSGSDPGGGPLDAETEKIIASLNLLVGSVGTQGGIIERNETPGYATRPADTRWSEIPDGSIEVLIVDGAESGYAIPWQYLAKKLHPEKSIVVSLSPMLNDIAAHADYLIPGPTCYESLSDIPTPSGSTFPTFAISAPLLPRPERTVEPIDVIRHIALQMGVVMNVPSADDIVREKARAIFNQRKGNVLTYADHSTKPITDFTDDESFWTALKEGAMWYGETKNAHRSMTFTAGLPSVHHLTESAEGLRLMPFGWRGATSASQISPILSKIFQESELRADHGTILVNPVTAKEYGLNSETPVTLTTPAGSMTVVIKIARSVRPGIIEAAVGPIRNGLKISQHPSGETILNLCAIDDNGTWRTTPAQFLKA